MLAALVLFSSSLLNTKPAPVFAGVRIGTNGPYRFLVDTGSQTSLIDPKLAADLRLTPGFRVDIITQSSEQLSPGTKARDLYIGECALPETELIFYDVTEARRLDPAVRGVPTLPAAIVERKATHADGLLPASVFQAIHVDWTKGELVLVRRPSI